MNASTYETGELVTIDRTPEGHDGGIATPMPFAARMVDPDSLLVRTWDPQERRVREWSVLAAMITRRSLVPGESVILIETAGGLPPNGTGATYLRDARVREDAVIRIEVRWPIVFGQAPPEMFPRRVIPVTPPSQEAEIARLREDLHRTETTLARVRTAHQQWVDQLVQDAHAMADDKELCGGFDDFMEKHDLPRRERDYFVQVTFRVMATVQVRARSDDDAMENAAQVARRSGLLVDMDDALNGAVPDDVHDFDTTFSSVDDIIDN